MTACARPGSSLDRTKWTRRARLLVRVLWLSLPLCALVEPVALAAAPSSDALFERYDVVTGPAPGQTVLTGFLLGGAVADLALVQVNGNDDTRLRIFAFEEGGWEPRLETKLDREVLFVDVADFGGRDRLLTYRPGRLSWFDPESATERALVDVAVSYNAAAAGLHYGGAETTEPFDAGEIPRLDITRDLNRDGREDLIVPDVAGFTVFIQTGDGVFGDPLRLGPPEPFRDETAFHEKRRYAEVGLTPLTTPWYLGRVHEIDYDRDGRTDLAFWNRNHFEVHLQDARGLFSPMAETFSVDVPFDTDGVYSLLFGFGRQLGQQNVLSMILGFGKTTGTTVLHSFRDMNGDGVADMVTFSVAGRSLLRLRSGYDVYYGVPTADGISFARSNGSSVRSRGKAPLGYSFQWLRDFDGDGQIDIMLGDVRTGFSKMIRALLNTSITLSSELYRLEDGDYPKEPTATRKIRSDIDIRGGRNAGFWPSVLVGDVNGDGRSDVLVAKNRKRLDVFLGGPDLLTQRPQEVPVDLPGDERNTWLVDLNRDGKQDVFMHHASAAEPHRVTMLIAR